jgi:hypothetical protein
MKTAVEWLIQELKENSLLTFDEWKELFEQAKEMESKQLFLASNTSAKDAYKAGQKTMQCGCYEISDALTYEEWLYENFKSQENEE